MTFTPDDLKWMHHALQLARQGEGYVEPNPMVGCVIVKTGRLIGEGYHRQYGQAHAEPNAINSCKVSPRKATAYVTLEPCCHHGKTPPCTDALLAAGVKRVVVAMADPFAKVAGQGLATLREHGVQVDVGLCEEQAMQLNEPYLKRLSTNRPWIIAKWAQTLDGYIAARSGDSKWISNEQSRHMVHELRSRVDGVMVGINTAIMDNATLTARDVPIKRIATRIVIDPSLRLPVKSNLVQTIDQAPLMLVARQEMCDSRKATALRKRGVNVLCMRTSSRGRINLQLLLNQLVTDYQMTNMLVEGGSHLHGEMFGRKLVDQVMVFVAPKLLGDPKGLCPVNTGQSIASISKGTMLQLRQSTQLGEDVILDYRVTKG
jgi:diaminohydroxyphosphoribosylaminopyrimidine deaminase/5-amino-6-(5-phosphoribosylamino)uracil reductase